MIVYRVYTTYSVALMAVEFCCVLLANAHTDTDTNANKQTNAVKEKKKNRGKDEKHFGKKGRWILFTTHTHAHVIVNRANIENGFIRASNSHFEYAVA